MNVKENCINMGCGFLFLILFFILPGVTFGGTVAFDFDPSSVTVVEKDQVYVFPSRVFEAHFGHCKAGDVVPVDKKYDGFLVREKLNSDKILSKRKLKSVVETICYGNATYYKKGKYFFFGRRKGLGCQDNIVRLTPQDIEFTWVVPWQNESRSLASFARAGAKNFFVKEVDGRITIKGEVIKSETLGVEAIAVANKIYYIKNSDNSLKPEAVAEVSVEKSQLLWVANRSF